MTPAVRATSPLQGLSCPRTSQGGPRPRFQLSSYDGRPCCRCEDVPSWHTAPHSCDLERPIWTWYRTRRLSPNDSGRPALTHRKVARRTWQRLISSRTGIPASRLTSIQATPCSLPRSPSWLCLSQRGLRCIHRSKCRCGLHDSMYCIHQT
ncbi:hypothetical protein C8Q76DRAFT_702874 [Earliella scabrosa]|nr:hypothetical protein C8Q76DRAFT_702874 [Earliella scabrosa]